MRNMKNRSFPFNFTWAYKGETHRSSVLPTPCVFCSAVAVIELPASIAAVQSDGTTHVCHPSAGGCNHGFSNHEEGDDPMKTRAEKMAEKKLDREIESLYRESCSNIQIPMLEIPAVFRAARAARAEGRDMREAIVRFVDSIRVDGPKLAPRAAGSAAFPTEDGGEVTLVAALEALPHA